MDQLDFARHLRHGQTDCESLLWSRVRAHRLFGLKFRRQQPVGPYVVDFFCAGHGLIVELDGGQHMDRAELDGERDVWLRGEGYVALRYWNNEVMGNLEGVLEDIALRAEVWPAQSPSPQPLCGPTAHPSLSSGPQLRCVLRLIGWSPRGGGALKAGEEPP